MVQIAHHTLLQRRLQELEVHDESGLRIHRAFDGDIHFVVVTVPVGIGAVAEDLGVLLVRPVRPIQTVRGTEVHAPGCSDDGHVTSRTDGYTVDRYPRSSRRIHSGIRNGADARKRRPRKSTGGGLLKPGRY